MAEKNMSQKSSNKVSRRNFLKKSAAAAAGFTIVPRYVLGGVGNIAPSERINVAIIGTGGQGITNIKGLFEHDDVQIPVICDVNEESDYSRFYYGGTAGSKPAMKLINEHHAMQGINKECKLYTDFRVMLEKEKNIDAVLVATPDHIHAVAAMAAIKAGKGVYCEKPLTHSIWETRKLTEAARKAGVATQMGNQGHSGEGIRLTVEWIRAGVIGNIREVHSWTGVGGTTWTRLAARPKDKPTVPKGFNWDLWLGPVQYRDYHPAYAPYNWRGWWDFGTGALGDMACHNIDPAIWALNLKYPESIEAHSAPLNDETVPTACIYYYKFAADGNRPAVDVTWYDGGLMPPRPEELEPGRNLGDNGILFVGDKGVIRCAGWGGSPRIIPEAKMKECMSKLPPKTLERSKGHHRDWLDACKGGKPPSSNFSASGPLTEIVLLGNVALRTGEKIYWDGPNMKAKNCDKADEFIRPVYRQGWSL